MTPTDTYVHEINASKESKEFNDSPDSPDLRIHTFEFGSERYRTNSADILAYYQRAVRKHGHDPRALGWSSELNQEQRFRAFFLGNDWLDQPSVLDVGCGQGDFFGFLDRQGLSVRYLGIDFCPEQLAIARDMYPGAVFEESDGLDFKTNELFDVVVGSGLVNHLQVDPELKQVSLHRSEKQNAAIKAQQMAYFKNVLAKLWSYSDSVVMLNMLSTHTPKLKQHPHLFFYYEPAEVLDLCLELTPYVSLHHNYLIQDFSVILNKG